MLTRRDKPGHAPDVVVFRLSGSHYPQYEHVYIQKPLPAHQWVLMGEEQEILGQDTEILGIHKLCALLYVRIRSC